MLHILNYLNIYFMIIIEKLNNLVNQLKILIYIINNN